MFTQAPPQSDVPGAHPQIPPEQDCPAGHGWLQAPQFTGSEVVSTQIAPHMVCPGIAQLPGVIDGPLVSGSPQAGTRSAKRETRAKRGERRWWVTVLVLPNLRFLPCPSSAIEAKAVERSDQLNG